MDRDNELDEIRKGLLAFSESGATRAKHGLITSLFPFIYEAARRLSTRAIGRWLEETHNVRISPAGISKALREADKHWEGYWELIEPSARSFEATHHIAMESFLFDRELFALRSGENPDFDNDDDQDQYWDAVDALRNDWFLLDDRTLFKMRQFVPKVATDKVASDEHRKTKTAKRRKPQGIDIKPFQCEA